MEQPGVIVQKHSLCSYLLLLYLLLGKQMINHLVIVCGCYDEYDNGNYQYKQAVVFKGTKEQCEDYVNNLYISRINSEFAFIAKGKEA